MNSPEKPMTDTFYIVDFDRTLADSDKLLEVFIEIAAQYIDLPHEQIEAADADVKARGDSFDTAKFVRDKLSDQDAMDRWDDLQKQFIHESRSLNMLLPGARELLEQLHERGKRYGILTYGNPLWQHLKLTAAGFNHVPRIVTVNKHKGAFVAGWQRDDGTFRLPQEFGGGITDRIIMIDDKAVSFEAFPPAPSQGYYVVDLENALPSQQGDIPANVTHCDDLYQVQNTLFS